jgi:hypothetical protein
MDLTQPDGSTLQAQLTPMETGGQMETLDGYTVVKNEQGWWTYAQAGDGFTAPSEQAVPSTLMAGKDQPQGPGGSGSGTVTDLHRGAAAHPGRAVIPRSDLG